MEEISLDGFQIVNPTTESILRQKRLVLELTQQEVADRARITLQQYQKFESGVRNIKTASFQLACRVIEALGMDVADFYHNKYVIGEEVEDSPEGFRYKKTGRLTTDNID